MKDLKDLKVEEDNFSSEALIQQGDLEIKKQKTDRFLTLLTSRLFFFSFFLLDLLWGLYALTTFTLAIFSHLLTLKKFSILKELIHSSWISLRRSLACGLSLFVALFNPAFGVMIACTYFLMYDKKGVEEIVPSVLQEHFKDFMES
ncbi:MAG: hypothetical protein ACOVOR_03425 [Rhabdochlamydiaceae bacterium]